MTPTTSDIHGNQIIENYNEIQNKATTEETFGLEDPLNEDLGGNPPQHLMFEGSVRSRCDQCDYSTEIVTLMSEHKERKHKAAKLACDKYDFVGTSLTNLNDHICGNQKWLRYACDQCNIKVKTKRNLLAHKNINHK